MIYESDLLIAPSEINMNCVENPFNMGTFYKLKVSFNMGTFSES